MASSLGPERGGQERQRESREKAAESRTIFLVLVVGL